MRLDPPAPLLRAELRRLAGVQVSEPDAAAAFGKEIAYYLDHHLEGRDAASLDELRERCAAVLGAGLPGPGVEPAVMRHAMLASLRFSAYPDVAPALGALRRRGLRLVVASNWDCSLPAALEQAGLGDAVDAVVSSAAVGVAKPGQDLFRAALSRAGVPTSQALHVGDSVDRDVGGALGAGLRAVLIARGENPPPETPPGVRVISHLGELARLL